MLRGSAILAVPAPLTEVMTPITRFPFVIGVVVIVGGTFGGTVVAMTFVVGVAVAAVVVEAAESAGWLDPEHAAAVSTTAAAATIRLLR